MTLFCLTKQSLPLEFMNVCRSALRDSLDCVHIIEFLINANMCMLNVRTLINNDFTSISTMGLFCR